MNMKKIISVVLCAMLMLSAAPVINTYAAEAGGSGKLDHLVDEMTAV